MLLLLGCLVVLVLAAAAAAAPLCLSRCCRRRSITLVVLHSSRCSCRVGAVPTNLFLLFSAVFPQVAKKGQGFITTRSSFARSGSRQTRCRKRPSCRCSYRRITSHSRKVLLTIFYVICPLLASDTPENSESPYVCDVLLSVELRFGRGGQWTKRNMDNGQTNFQRPFPMSVCLCLCVFVGCLFWLIGSSLCWLHVVLDGCSELRFFRSAMVFRQS